jgi:hypothetical protein
MMYDFVMSNEQIDTDGGEAVRLNDVKIFPTFLSLFLPGCGQFAQKRFSAGLAFLFVFACTAFFPFATIVGDVWLRLPTILAQEMLSGMILCVLPFLVMAFSCLDTILWQQDKKTHFRHWLGTLIISLFPIALLLSISTLGTPRESACRVQCRNNVKNILFAILNYADINGHLPPAYTTDKDGNPLHSWRVLLLPYLEQATLYKKIRLDEPWDSEYNKQFHSQMPREFRCPSNRQAFTFIGEFAGFNKTFRFSDGCCYSLVVGNETVFNGSTTAKFEGIKDGTSNTVLLVERITPVNWMEPNNDIPFTKACCGIDKDISGIGSMHPDGCHCGFADGKVQFLPSGLALEKLKAMLMKGGEKNTASD